VMDEVTSALDRASEEAIVRLIENLRGSLTVIAIAHRALTVSNADEVVSLREGAVEKIVLSERRVRERLTREVGEEN